VRQRAAAQAHVLEAIRAARRPYAAALADRANGYVDHVFWGLRSGRIVEMLGAMIFGMGLFKTGFLSGAATARTYALTAVWGYTLSAPLLLFGLWQLQQQDFAEAAAMRWLYLPYVLTQIPATLANVSVVLLALKGGWLRPVSHTLAAVGRTAFSSYLLTSVLCQLLFVCARGSSTGHGSP
jgi:uncharacterized protein